MSAPNIKPFQSQIELEKLTRLMDSSADMPHKEEVILQGIKWGDYCQLYTPAFWKLLYNFKPSLEYQQHRLGSTLLEEIIACMLGGYGIPSEIGLLAFRRLKTKKLIKANVKHSEIIEALSTPFLLKSEKTVKYRFTNQKSYYIYKLLQRDDLNLIPQHDDLTLRDWLLTVEGIGYKTASWITRNWLNSENVAILDIHIIRAGILTGFYKKEVNVSKEYLSLENTYLQFCEALNVCASRMDAIIWEFMKKNNRFALDILKN